MLNGKNKITLFQILYAIALFSLIIFSSIAKEFPHLSIERKIYEALPFLPVGLIGLITLIKPSLPLKAFRKNKKEIKSIDLWTQRCIGFAWILLSVVRIFTIWN